MQKLEDEIMQLVRKYGDHNYAQGTYDMENKEFSSNKAEVIIQGLLLQIREKIHDLVLQLDHSNLVVEAAKEKIEELQAMPSKAVCRMGVGTGDGNLFVYGDYESIKAAQSLVLKAEGNSNFADALDAKRYRWLRNENAYVPEEIGVTGGHRLDNLCDQAIAEEQKP